MSHGTDGTDEFRAEVAAAVARSVEKEGRRGADDHPTPDKLTAYRQGRTEDAETERIQEHLVLCRECLDRLAELEEFVEAGGEGPPEIASLEEAAAWRALRPRLRTPGRTVGGTVPLALAAAILVAAIGLGLWAIQQRMETGRLRGELARLSQPQAAATIVDLYSESAVRGGAEEPASVDLSATDHLTVILHLPEAPEMVVYEAEIVDAEDRTLWRGRVRREDYIFTLGIPRSFVDAGSYRIHLYGVIGEERRRIETFPMDLVDSSG